MELLRHSIELLVNPFFICLLILGIFSVFLCRGSYPRLLRIAIPTIFILLLIMSTGWVPRWLTRQLESQYPIIVSGHPAVKWIVVLSGGQSRVTGMPANDLLFGSSLKRLVEGVRLLRTIPAAKLVLSGGNTTGGTAEALVLNQVAGWFAIPEPQIVLEVQSTNTADQARELVALLHDQPFYLVTSAIHMPRAMVLFQQHGLHPIAAPTDFTFFWESDDLEKIWIPNTYNMSYFSIALHELLGKAWALVSG